MIHRKKTRTKIADVSYWRSYSDMMAAMLLMFILIMVLVLAVNSDQAEALRQQEAELQSFLGIKPQIISELKEEFPNVEIDPNTGDIQFKSDILFDYNKSDIKPEGATFLENFIPKYLDILFGKHEKDVAEIIIEGHTDKSGGYSYNLQLSQERALSVANFIIGDNSHLAGKYTDTLRGVITVTGKSYSKPVNVLGIYSPTKSRRVELKFRLKDDEAIRKIEEIMSR